MEPLGVVWRIIATRRDLEKVMMAAIALYHNGGTIVVSPLITMVKSSRGWIRVRKLARTCWLCPCDAYRFSDTMINDHPVCKHVIAAILAVAAADPDCDEDRAVGYILGLTPKPIMEVKYVSVSRRPKEASPGVACPDLGQDCTG